jgi:hypothetical protein
MKRLYVRAVHVSALVAALALGGGYGAGAAHAARPAMFRFATVGFDGVRPPPTMRISGVRRPAVGRMSGVRRSAVGRTAACCSPAVGRALGARPAVGRNAGCCAPAVGRMGSLRPYPRMGGGSAY